MQDDEIDPDEPKPDLPCVTCGAGDVTPVVWGFPGPDGIPGLMRALNLCTTCKEYVGRTILGAELEEARAEIRVQKRTARELRKHLRRLVETVSWFLLEADRIYEGPATHTRGSAVARLMNKLNVARDVAARFGLGKRT